MKKLIAMLICAAPLCASWTDCVCDGNFGVSAEYLYWEPCAPAFGWASKNMGPDSDRLHDVLILRPGYNSGFRIGADWMDSCCETFAELRYTYYDQQSVQTAHDASPMFIDGNNVGKYTVSQARLHFNYQTASLRAGYSLYNKRCWHLFGFGDVRYIHLEQGQTVEGFDSENGVIARRRSFVGKEFNGGSVGLGGYAEYNIGCGFGLMGEVVVLLGLGNQNTNSDVVQVNAETTPVGAVFRTTNRIPSTLGCLGGFDVKLGGNYTWCCNCFTIVGSVAYELNYYLNVLRIDATTSNTGTVSLGFHGLTAGLHFLF